MKKITNTLAMATIILGSLGFGLVTQAQDNTAGHLNFEKGELEPLPVDPEDPSKPGETPNVTVPTFDFGTFKVGQEEIGRKVLPEGEQSKSKGLTSTGIGNFTGDEKAWTLKLTADNFKLTNEKASSAELSDITLDFDKLKVWAVEDHTPLGNQSPETTVTTGKDATAIFTSETGELASGKFQFDYSDIAMTVPQKTAQQAKTKAYRSVLTWNLSAVNDKAEGQVAALPAK